MRRWAKVCGRTLNYRETTGFSVEVGNGKSPYTVIHRGPCPYAAETEFQCLSLDAGCKKRFSMTNIEGERFTVAQHKTVKQV